MMVKAVIVDSGRADLKRSLRVGIQSGLGLAQVGEFSFVLAGSGVMSVCSPPINTSSSSAHRY